MNSIIDGIWKKKNWETLTTLCQERHTPESLKQLKICLLSLQHCTTFRKNVFRNPRQGLGWSGGAIVLGKLPVLGRPIILITVGQGPTALAVGAGGGCLDIFILIYPFSSFSLSLGDGPI